MKIFKLLQLIRNDANESIRERIDRTSEPDAVMFYWSWITWLIFSPILLISLAMTSGLYDITWLFWVATVFCFWGFPIGLGMIFLVFFIPVLLGDELCKASKTYYKSLKERL